jgi:small subunit ribosomal protein S9
LNDEPQNDAPQDDAPQEETPQEEAPQEENPQEETPQAETPSEETPAAEERPTPAQDPGSTEDPTPAEPTPGPQEGEEQPEPSPAQDPDQEAPSEPEQQAAPEPKPEEPAKKGEAIPGAELDPIAISDEKDLSAEERARREADAEERARREAEATAESRDDETPASIKPAELAKDARYSATGKRKNSVARVIVKPGGGAIVVNGRPLEEYFPRPQLQTIAKQSLVTSGYEGTVDVVARAHGGGISGQAAAVRHGIAKALTEIDPNLRAELKKRGLLTRDARVKERRKAGLKKARKKPQFSKR